MSKFIIIPNKTTEKMVIEKLLQKGYSWEDCAVPYHGTTVSAILAKDNFKMTYWSNLIGSFCLEKETVDHIYNGSTMGNYEWNGIPADTRLKMTVAELKDFAEKSLGKTIVIK